MSLSTTQYGYIVDPMVPFTDDKGKTIKNGFIRVFMAGTSTPVLTYRNYDGATNQEKIDLDNSGRVKHNVIGSKGSLYKVVVYNILHSQENPLLTVDKIAVLGASINASGATIVTGLDSVTVQEENFLKATVDGTDVELALDPTEVTSELITTADAVTAAPDYVVPLLDKTGTNDSKKISLANIFKFALDWISRLATTVTSFASGDFIVVSNTTNGSRKMAASKLLELTAQNALAGNVAPAFDPTRTSANPYKAGESVSYEGKTYTFKVDHYGSWSAADVNQTRVGCISYRDSLSIVNQFIDDFKGFGKTCIDIDSISVVASTGVVADPANALYGIEAPSSSCKLYKDIRCDNLKKIVLDFPFFYSQSAAFGLVFFGYDGSVLSSHLERGNVDVNTTSSVVVDVPTGAYKFSVSEFNDVTPQIFGIYELNRSVEFVATHSVVACDYLSEFGLFTEAFVTKSCKPIYCGDCTKLYVSNLVTSSSVNSKGIVFYNESMIPLVGYFSKNAIDIGVSCRVFSVPSGASFVSFTIPNAENTYTFEKINDSGLDGFVLGDKIADVELDEESDFTQGAISNEDGTDIDTGTIYDKRIRTDFFKVNGGTFVFTTFNTNYSVLMFEYDHQLSLKRFTNGVLNNYVKLRDETCYIRFCVQHVARVNGDASTMIDTEPSEYDDIGLKFTTYNFFVSKGIKKEYTENYERFKVLVNQTPLPDEDYSDVYAQTTDYDRIQTLYAHSTNTLNDSEKLLTTTGVIALPPSYTKNGHKTKLILFAHGGHGYVDETHWYPTVAHFPITIRKLLAAGYAVFDCNGYKDTPYEEMVQTWNNGNVQISEGLPQVCQAYYKCYKYIVENYNVDPRIYIWGCSQGGHLSINFGWCYRDIVAAVAVMAGQIDLYDQGYSYQTLENKRQVAKLLGFADTTFSDDTEAMAAYEHYRADKWDPMQRIVEIDGKKYVMGWNTPVKFFYGTNDTILPQVQYTINLVEALQNSKVICYMRTYTGFDHSDVASGKSEIAIREAVEWFNRF